MLRQPHLRRNPQPSKRRRKNRHTIILITGLGYIGSHVAVVNRLETLTAVENPYVANVGTGTGTTVLEMLACFERATGCGVPYTVGPRREGDLAAVVAAVVAAIDPARMAALGWKPTHTLEKSCRNAWNFTEHCRNANTQNHLL
jgi:UDP-glucose 4-epimerase